MPTNPEAEPPRKPRKIPKTEVCETYGISLRTVDRWIAEGRLKAYRIGNKIIRLDADEVEQALVSEM
jgi:excisionase family DNA binding protein